MAFFGVTIETVDTVKKHPNADRLELVTLKGISYQCISAKGMWGSRDKCLYFPIDSLLPDSVAERLGVKQHLSGDYNRVKTIRLRGEYSQGILGPLSLWPEIKESWSSREITSYLGVTKYEPPAQIQKNCRTRPLPACVSFYDIEGCSRYPDIVEQLMDVPVNITEKMEGSNFSITWNPSQKKIHVCSHRRDIEEHLDGSHVWVQTASKQRLFQKLAKFTREMDLTFETPVSFYGEICGPKLQGNIYHLKEYVIYLFDIKVGNRWLEPDDFIEKAKDLRLITVPCISHGQTLREWLADRNIQEAADGKTMAVSKCRGPREGIVIKPMKEQFSAKLKGRLILKQRSLKYLATKN